MLRFLAAALLTVTLIAGAAAQKKKNKKDEEPPTQVLPAQPEPPDAIAAETARLSFQVSPLSNKGLLSQQVRDALKSLLRDGHGAQIVKLRAFVAGSGDLRRVQTIMVEEFTERKLSLPVLSTIQVGGLPLTGAQVVIEATSVERREGDSGSLFFYPAMAAKDVASGVAELRKRGPGLEFLRATCYVGSLEDATATRVAATATFPGASLAIVQTQRQSLEPFVACEGAARMPKGMIISLGNGEGLASTPKIIFTGTKLVFRGEDGDIRLAFQRLEKAIEPWGATSADVFWTGVYPLTRPVAAKINAVRFDFVSPAAAPASSPLLFEGLPSTDATAAIEIMAAGK